MTLYAVANMTTRTVILPPHWRVKDGVDNAVLASEEQVVVSPGCDDDEEVIKLMFGRRYRKLA